MLVNVGLLGQEVALPTAGLCAAPSTRFPKRTWGMPGMSLRCVLLIEKTDVKTSSKQSGAEVNARF